MITDSILVMRATVRQRIASHEVNEAHKNYATEYPAGTPPRRRVYLYPTMVYWMPIRSFCCTSQSRQSSPRKISNLF